MAQHISLMSGNLDAMIPILKDLWDSVEEGGDTEDEALARYNSADITSYITDDLDNIRYGGDLDEVLRARKNDLSSKERKLLEIASVPSEKSRSIVEVPRKIEEELLLLHAISSETVRSLTAELSDLDIDSLANKIFNEELFRRFTSTDEVAKFLKQWMNALKTAASRSEAIICQLEGV